MLPAGVLVGATVLLHAAYSSYEFFTLLKLKGIHGDAKLPTDVTIETLIGLLLVIVSATARGFSQMAPIRVPDLNVTRTLEDEQPYAYLESRPNFQDLVGKRKEFLDWRRQATTATTKTKKAPQAESTN